VGWGIKARPPPRPSLISCQRASNPDPPPQGGKKKGGHRDQSSSSLPCSWGWWIPPARVGIKSAATYCLVQTPSPSAIAVGSRCCVRKSFRRGVTSPSSRDSKADPVPGRGSACAHGRNTGVREAVGSSTGTGRRRFFHRSLFTTVVPPSSVARVLVDPSTGNFPSPWSAVVPTTFCAYPFSL
jgi:hypothetical protein